MTEAQTIQNKAKLARGPFSYASENDPLDESYVERRKILGRSSEQIQICGVFL